MQLDLVCYEPFIMAWDLTDFLPQLPRMITSGKQELFQDSYQIFLDKLEDDEIISELEKDNRKEWLGLISASWTWKVFTAKQNSSS